jgi:hypothetical protein
MPPLSCELHAMPNTGRKEKDVLAEMSRFLYPDEKEFESGEYVCRV